MTTRSTTRVRKLAIRETRFEIRADNLPAGVCGQMQGIALVYGVVDAYGTRFLAGCLDRTKREKLAAGKVQLYLDHEYGVRTHIGVVRKMETAGDSEVMFADLFDTEDGRRAKEYLSAVLAADAQTGLSIGFFERAGEWQQDEGEFGAYDFSEIELEEISITPRPAVPGATVTGVRREGKDDVLWTAFDTLVSTLPAEAVRARMSALLGNADDSTDTRDAATDSEDATDETDSRVATLDERIAAVRQSYRR